MVKSEILNSKLETNYNYQNSNHQNSLYFEYLDFDIVSDFVFSA